MKILSLLAICATLPLFSWNDHPDLPDHSKTDFIFKLAQKQTNASEYERKKMIEIEQKEISDFLAGIYPDELCDFKDGKFIKDKNDKKN